VALFFWVVERVGLVRVYVLDGDCRAARTFFYLLSLTLMTFRPLRGGPLVCGCRFVALDFGDAVSFSEANVFGILRPYCYTPLARLFTSFSDYALATLLRLWYWTVCFTRLPRFDVPSGVLHVPPIPLIVDVDRIILVGSSLKMVGLADHAIILLRFLFRVLCLQHDDVFS
jgi:hypothetical protein